MIKIIDKINNFIDKVGMRNFMLLVFIVIVFIIGGLYGTFSLFTTSSVTYIDNVRTYKFIIGDNDHDKITIDSFDSKYIDITVSNQESIDLLYSLYYKSADDVIVGVLDDSDSQANGTIQSNSDNIISLRVFNNSSTSASITLGVNYGTVDGGEVSVDGQKITEVIKNLDQSGANEPKLDDGMIPVFYDEENSEWAKADSENMNSKFKWYDYSNSNKMWANAVLVTNDKREEYLNSKVGTTINTSDILAFYVWIPRYKYHVWNITRNLNEGMDYSYNASHYGIDIEFEKNIDVSGNMFCNYDIGDNNLGNELVDECKYNNNLITVGNSNSDYKDVWYTHPAFYYGGKKLTGFWIGKFETTGTTQTPTILPDQKSLTSQNVSDLFNINNLFKNYGLGSSVDVHVSKNIEWGAVAYLTHSNYGICSDSLCHELYVNNSKSLYTGRSGGNIAGSDNLELKNVYPNSANSMEKYSDYGYYNYQGYLIDYSGHITSTKDKSKISSTTGNIYGIYDMAGGALEVVMANSLNSGSRFNSAKSGFKSDLSEKYYDVYSYGESGNNQLAINRTLMGDAIGEVSFLEGENLKSWSSIYSRPDDVLSFIDASNPWLVRGGSYNQNDSGIFKYTAYDGDSKDFIGFRSVLS